MLDEFYRIAFRKKVYETIAELQTDLDAWIADYNQARPHQGRYCFGKTPFMTFLDAAPTAREKQITQEKIAHGLAARYVLDVCGVSQDQLEIAANENVPDRLPVDPVASMAMWVHPCVASRSANSTATRRSPPFPVHFQTGATRIKNRTARFFLTPAPPPAWPPAGVGGTRSCFGTKTFRAIQLLRQPLPARSPSPPATADFNRKAFRWHTGQITIKPTRGNAAVLPVAVNTGDAGITLAQSCTPTTIARGAQTTCSVTATNTLPVEAKAKVVVSSLSGLPITSVTAPARKTRARCRVERDAQPVAGAHDHVDHPGGDAGRRVPPAVGIRDRAGGRGR